MHLFGLRPGGGQVPTELHKKQLATTRIKTVLEGKQVKIQSASRGCQTRYPIKISGRGGPAQRKLRVPHFQRGYSSPYGNKIPQPVAAASIKVGAHSERARVRGHREAESKAPGLLLARSGAAQSKTD